MLTEKYIELVLSRMREYQRINNVTRGCVNNSVVLYDLINLAKNNTIKPELCAGVCVYLVGIKLVMNIHCWVRYDGKNLDPSYDVSHASTSDRDYIDNLAEFFSEYGELIEVSDKRKYILKVLYFKKSLKALMSNNEASVKDYKKQMLYVCNTEIKKNIDQNKYYATKLPKHLSKPIYISNISI